MSNPLSECPHKPTGIITGFRNMDGAVISRCKFCDTPIVCTEWVASPSLHNELYPNAVKEKSERI